MFLLAGDDEVAPEGVGTGPRPGRQLAHQRPARGTAYENGPARPGVQRHGVPRAKSHEAGNFPAGRPTMIPLLPEVLYTTTGAAGGRGAVRWF